MAESRKIYTNQAYFADFENDVANTPADFKGLGYYRRTSLEDVINNFSEEKLKLIIKIFGEEKEAAKIAKNIVKARSICKITKTEQLVNIILNLEKLRLFHQNDGEHHLMVHELSYYKYHAPLNLLVLILMPLLLLEP